MYRGNIHGKGERQNEIYCEKNRNSHYNIVNCLFSVLYGFFRDPW